MTRLNEPQHGAANAANQTAHPGLTQRQGSPSCPALGTVLGMFGSHPSKLRIIKGATFDPGWTWKPGSAHGFHRLFGAHAGAGGLWRAPSCWNDRVAASCWSGPLGQLIFGSAPPIQRPSHGLKVYLTSRFSTPFGPDHVDRRIRIHHLFPEVTTNVLIEREVVVVLERAEPRAWTSSAKQGKAARWPPEVAVPLVMLAARCWRRTASLNSPPTLPHRQTPKPTSALAPLTHSLTTSWPRPERTPHVSRNPHCYPSPGHGRRHRAP